MATSCFSALTSKAQGQLPLALRILLRSTTIILLVLLLSPQGRANLNENSWIFHDSDGRDHEFKRSGSFRGTPYVCLPEIASKLKLNMLYDPQTFQVMLYNPQRANYSLFKTYSSKVQIVFGQGNAQNFEKARKNFILPAKFPKTTITVGLSRRPEFIEAELCVPIEFGDRVLRPLMTGKAPQTPKLSPSKTKARIIIDAGHGGNDYGASFDKILEKDLVLLLAQDLQASLKNHSIEAQLTRENDTFVTLSERARIANQSSAELFLSLHMNAHPSRKDLEGFEIYVLSLTSDDSQGRAAVAREQQMIPDDLPEGIERAAADLRAGANFEQSLTWSDKLNKSLRQVLKPSSSRSVRMGPFYVLYAAQMPALLLELGYISHESDRNKILDAEQRKIIVENLAQSIAARLNQKTKASLNTSGN